MTSHIEILIDDEFGYKTNFFGQSQIVAPKGITQIKGSKAFVDPQLFQYCNFYKPIQKLIKYEQSLTTLNKVGFQNLFQEFGKIKEVDSNSNWNHILELHPDNCYDLKSIYLSKDKICFQYINCPINDFFVTESNNHWTINLSPFSKSYYTCSDTDWWYFTDYLDKIINPVEIRDFKISEILDETNSTNNFKNVIRQLQFIVKNRRNISNSFLDSVYSYYQKKGFISKKQADCVAKIIW